MTNAMERDSQTLHQALAVGGDRMDVTLSRETVELVVAVLDARALGEPVLVVDEDAEVSPAEAAPMLGMSRPQVRKLMETGLLEHRMVGTHNRIKVASIRAFKGAERARSRTAMTDLCMLQNELGLTE